MRIALVSHNIVKGDGQGRVNYELARHLFEQGVDVHLLADQVAPKLLELGCTWHPIHPGFNSIDLLKVARFTRGADATLSELDGSFDAVLACGVVLTHPHTVNAVHFVHGPWLRSPYHNARQQSGLQSWYQYAFSALNARWEKQTFGRARHVVAVSEMVRQELREIGVPDDKISVVVNGVDLREFSPGRADRDALGLPEDVLLGLFVGDIKSPIKNLDTVLRALVHVSDAHLAVAGTADGSPYPSLAADLGVADRVHFLGFRRDVSQLMRAADVFLLPSRRDSCPLVLLEALASGLPVIASQNVGNANLLGNSGGFVLDDPEDADTLATHLSTLAGDASLRASMGRTARDIAEQHSWDQMAARYLTIFRALATAPVPA
jgi:glycosyltransferase involved in cell wall biosynthesis